MEITKQRIKVIKTLVTKLNVQHADALAIGVSYGRTSRVSQLTEAEGKEMERELRKLDVDAQKRQRLVSKLFGLAYQYHGIGYAATDAEKKDVQRQVFAWVRKYGVGVMREDERGELVPVHVDLNDYTAAELPKLVTQFEGVYRQFLQELK